MLNDHQLLCFITHFLMPLVLFSSRVIPNALALIKAENLSWGLERAFYWESGRDKL